ncbi:MAG TPA: gluconeogenesis factor YvcK family protein [Thermoanaerobaculia bacterium]|nr:gluconeogenesis factor YvcK family protein [Thermoanaerobaculia bacterium]
MTERPLRIVGLGGGTGLAVLLSGLSRCAQRPRRCPVEISAIVSTADDGGSTGKLREHMGLPAVGDLRNCIVALAQGHPLWSELFQHRFVGGNGLSGHALGNLVMAALAERHGGLGAAVEQLTRPLDLRGRVLPVTEEQVTLCAELEGGELVYGESRIPAAGRPIERLWLCPHGPAPADGVLEAIAAADALVLGPGSLYTSLLPNLLVDGVADAFRASGALRIFISNLMTQPGETDGFDAADHLRVIEGYLGPGAVDVCVVNVTPPPPDLAVRYAAAGSQPVAWDRSRLAEHGVLAVPADLRGGGTVLDRHDPVRLGEIVLSLAEGLRPEAGLAYEPGAVLPARQGAAAEPIASSRIE